MKAKKPADRKPFAVKVGNHIRQARIEKEMTQAELGEKVRKSEKYISNLESGQNLPSVELLVSLCHFLDVSPNDLLMDSPEINPIYTLNPEMEKLARMMTPDTKQMCLKAMAMMIELQNKKSPHYDE